MNPPQPLIVFALDQWRYALRLAVVERITWVAEITPLPQAPGIIQGAINVQGIIIPVVNVRRRFRLPEREVALSDHLILARTATRPVALIADEVVGLLEQPQADIAAVDTILPGMDYVAGVAKQEDGLILIHDLDAFLSLEEETTLDAALTRTGGAR